MTIQNNSFEVPDGLPPEFESASSEPFPLIDGTFLDVDIVARGGHSGVYRWDVDAADFADINAATAAEVRNSINNADLGFLALSSGGKVILKSQFSGSTMRIIGGHPQTILLWPTEARTGTTQIGPGQDWIVQSTAGYLQWGGFGAAPELPAESFETGWDLVSISFDLSDVFIETFELGWNINSVTGAYEAGLFDGVDNFEGFERGWTLFTVLPLYDDALFNGTDTFESFEEGWNIANPADPPAYEEGRFNDGGPTYDSFENYDKATHRVTLVTAVAGPYRIIVDGTVYTYVASGGDDINDIAEGLDDELDAGTQVLSVWVANTLRIRPAQPRPGLTMFVEVEGPASNAIRVVLAENDPTLRDVWIGRDFNWSIVPISP